MKTKDSLNLHEDERLILVNGELRCIVNKKDAAQVVKEIKVLEPKKKITIFFLPS